LLLLANDTNNGIEQGSDFRSGSLPGNTSALGQPGKPLDPSSGHDLPCKSMLCCTACVIRQQSSDKPQELGFVNPVALRMQAIGVVAMSMSAMLKN